MKTLDISFSAPCKIIITGEHSAVYGEKALAIPLNLFTTCSISDQIMDLKNESLLSISLENKSFEISLQKILVALKEINKNNSEFIEKAIINNFPDINDAQIKKCLEILIKSILYFSKKQEIQQEQDFLLNIINLLESIEHINISIQVSSQIPIGKGLGSSASFLASFASCWIFYLIKRYQTSNQDSPLANKFDEILNFNSNKLFYEIMNEIIYQLEKIFHGQPSGLDNSTIVNGQPIIFQREKEKTLIKTIQINNFCDEIILIDSGLERNTSVIVNGLREKYIKNEEIQKKISEIGKITQQIIELIVDAQLSLQSFTNFGELIKNNQKLLKELDLSHKKNDEIVSICESQQVPCKLTGAGQGGFCIAFVKKQFISETQKQIILKNLNEQQYKTFECKLSNKGLTCLSCIAK